MSQQRQAKRARISKGGAYHDSVPLDDDDDFDLIHAREERLLPFGYSLRTTAVEQEHQLLTDSWAQRSTWAPPDDTDLALDPNGELYDDVLRADVLTEAPVDSNISKRTRSNVARRPNVVWKDISRELYLDELLRWHGRGDFINAHVCLDCTARGIAEPGLAEYRCAECYQPDLLCAPCCRWYGERFTKISLKSIGLKIQLNHASMSCTNPIPCHTDLRILHTNGIHDVALLYCGCERAIPHHQQLLRRRFYPASQINVQSSATFELLRTLHLLLLTTKASVYDFYGGIDKLTDNTTTNPSKSRYRALLRMSLQWRHLKMLMRAGRGHDPGGVLATKPGELAVPCPSCPCPGVNLPDDWESAPPGMQFLYAVFLCMDANFRLKNNLVSNYSQDPGLGTGLSYMVPRKGFEDYVLSRANEQDISTCVGFQALSKANTKNSAGLRYTGVNMTVCGRSEMIMPTGVGNLQKGERYCNMDYIFGSVLQTIGTLMVIISYDVACQWFVNLGKRIDQHWPSEIKPKPGMKFTPAIPKLHEPMHQTAGHQVYSFNCIPGCGHTDGECIERVWAALIALANATRAQGPGSRQDVLDDNFGFWNWLKYVAMGLTLLRRYKAAVEDRNVQTEAHRGLTESLEEGTVQKWRQMCEAWDADQFPKKVQNPYETTGITISEAEVRRKFATDEDERIIKGGVVHHATSAASFLVMGLDLEDAQRRLRRLAKKTPETATARQTTNLTEQRTQLRTRIQAWEKLCPIYMPGLLQYWTDLGSKLPPTSDTPNTEDITLWLPSKVESKARVHVCREGLVEMEDKLRGAQCRDALNSIRHILKIKTRMIAFKNKNLHGQRQGTRSRAVIDRVHDKAKAFVEKYRAARAAKFALVDTGDWELELQVLNDGDVRGYQDPDRLKPRPPRQGIFEDDQPVPDAQGSVQDTELSLYREARSQRDGTGETKRTLSWIWLGPQSRPDNTKEDDDILRSEWAKSRARSLRASEEVSLLKEEMRRVLEFLGWKSRWWIAKVDHGRAVDNSLQEGLASYARSQAAIQSSLEGRFRKLWDTPLKDAVTDEDVDGEDGEDDDTRSDAE